jgi:3-hydroxyisobutyrate dehydrogenase
MAKIGFVGLGNMGLPMAQNLLKAGHEVAGFDVAKSVLEKLTAAKGTAVESVPAACRGAEVIITMLPAGQHVRVVYSGENGVLANAGERALLIDCSTIDVATARAVATAAGERGLAMLDAPVSGAWAGRKPGHSVHGRRLHALCTRPTDLVGDGQDNCARRRFGQRQAAKICNNMILGASMIAVSEGFILAERLGLDAQNVRHRVEIIGPMLVADDVLSVPGPVPSSPANRNYQAGFTAAMMLKDLKLAQEAAQSNGAPTPLGAQAAALYGLYAAHGLGSEDFSGIIRFLRGD